MEWLKHSPVFESDQLNPVIIEYSPWSGHRLFAYDYVSALKPEVIVELGSFYGCSSFAFLQAVKDNKLETAFYAVDTWEGDSFTENDYKEDIYSEYVKIQNRCFKDQHSKTLRMTFDEAVLQFEDHSIDLLHIDGSHSYEDVKHDYDTWREKVKKSGAIFFHDIGTDLLDGKTLGSHRFWEELKEKNEYTFEFPCSFGLGVLLFDDHLYTTIKKEIDFAYYQQQANLDAAVFKDVIRKQFFELRSLRSFAEGLNTRLEIDRQQITAYKRNVEGKDEYIGELQTERQNISADYEETIKGKDQYIEELETAIKRYKTTDRTRKTYIDELEKQIKGLQDKIHQLSADIEKINAEYEHNIENYKHSDSEKTTYIASLEESICLYQKNTQEKDDYIDNLEKRAESFKAIDDERRTYIRHLEEEIQMLHGTIDGLMSDVNRINREYKENLTRYKAETEAKSKYIEELKLTISGYDEDRQEKEGIIQELKERAASLLTDLEASQAKTGDLERTKKELSETIHHLRDDITLEKQEKERTFNTLSNDLKKAMKNSRDDQALIQHLQCELFQMKRQLEALKNGIMKLPFGEGVLKKLEMQSVELRRRS